MLSTRERSGDDRFMLLDLMQGIGLRTLDGATRLFELNLRATRALVDETTGRLKAAFDPQARSGLPVPPMPDIERATSYSRDVYRIVAGTNAEIVELMQQHVRVGWTGGAARPGGIRAGAQHAVQAAAAALERSAEQVLSQDEPAAPASTGAEPALGRTEGAGTTTEPATVQAALAAESSGSSDSSEPAASTASAATAAIRADQSVDSPLDRNAAQPASAEPDAAAETASESAPAPQPFELAAALEASQVPMAQMPDPPASLSAPQPIAQAVHAAIEQVAQLDAAPVVPEAPKRPRATRIARAASRKSAPNAS